MSRAMSQARISRWPPPMVSNCAPRVTSILVPGSRGPEPSTMATVTSTAGSAAAVSQSLIMMASADRRSRGDSDGGDGAQDFLAGRRRVQCRIDLVAADAGYRVAYCEEHRERQQQRRFADCLGAVDAVLDVGVVVQAHAEVLGTIGDAGDFIEIGR